MFFKEKPVNFPSKSAKELKNTEFRFKEDLTLLVKNKNFLRLNVPFVMSYSVHHTMSAVLSSILTPFDYTAREASFIGITYILCGITGAFYFSAVLDKKKMYLQSLKIVSWGSLFAWSTGFFTLPSKNFPILCCSMSVVGFMTLPMLPVGYSFGVEISHPVS
jgi:hypothetical protein